MNLALSLFFFVLSVALTKLFLVLAADTRLMDKPNDRSMHLKPTIRGGGLIFIGLSLLSLPILCFMTQTPFWGTPFVLMLAVFLVAAVSFLDDLYNLSAKPRFLVQCMVALLLVLFIRPQQLDFGLFTLSYSVLIVPFLFITSVWAINHFNFMDGIDGFCASQAIFLGVAYAVLFALYGATFYQSFCWVFISCLTGFLVFNFPPAKLFMGDVGSATLGLITFSLALVGQQKFQIPILYWFMLNGLFLFDATCTLIRRFLKKEQWSAPHRKHAYQRLRQYGLTVPRILLGQLLINSFFFVLVLLLNLNRFYPLLLILLQIGFVLLIYYLIEKKFPMFQSQLTA